MIKQKKQKYEGRGEMCSRQRVFQKMLDGNGHSLFPLLNTLTFEYQGATTIAWRSNTLVKNVSFLHGRLSYLYTYFVDILLGSKSFSGPPNLPAHQDGRTSLIIFSRRPICLPPSSTSTMSSLPEIASVPKGKEC
jgi:hypothetical protein